MIRHENTFLQIDELGTRWPAYQPTFEYDRPYISPYHEFLSKCPRKNEWLIKIKTGQSLRTELIEHARDFLVGARNMYRFGRVIPGWLLREDAMKLYEMAYFAQGDILELGSYHGLSTSIMARAIQDAGGGKTLYTVDLDPSCIMATIRNLRRTGLARGVVTLVDDGASAVRRFAAGGKRFSFVFIDHSHAYQPVLDVCRELPGIVSPDTLCLFHDYNHPGNRDPKNSNYGVYAAICDGLDPQQFEFYGVFGGAGLYRAR